MPQTITLEVKGVHTYNSELSGVPRGALKVGKNINLSRLNIAEPRRGFDFLGYSFSNAAERAKKIIFHDSNAFYHHGSTLSIDTGSAFASRGSISEPSNSTSIKYATLAKNLYLTSSQGIKKLDDAANNIYSAGIPRGLNMDLTLTASGGDAVLAGNKVAYRHLFGRKDANGNIYLGAVSGRFERENTTVADENVDQVVYLPDGIDDTYFAQIYRSVNSTATPNDNLQLTYEYRITSTDVTNGYFTFTDITPDDLLGATIYTAPSQEGIANNNIEPPLARDIAEYKQHLFFADVESKHKFQVTLLAVGGTNGLNVGDKIFISDGVTNEEYTAAAAYDAGADEFKLDTSGTNAQDIQVTTESLVKLINEKSTLVYAYPLSTGEGDQPGRILLESRTLANVAFTVTSDVSTCWVPVLQSTADVNQTSTNDQFLNGLMFSKQGQGEAVPTKNIFFVGRGDSRILRIIALRDGLVIQKEYDGHWILRGDNEASFSIAPLDLTANLIAPDTSVSVNNVIYALCEAGLAQVTDSAVSYISLPIKDQLLPLYSEPLEDLKDYSFGIGYETEGKYLLCVIAQDNDVTSKRQWIFDVYGLTFAEWDLNLSAGAVSPYDGKLYLGMGDEATVKVERKSFDYTDFADQGATRTITNVNGTTLTLDSVAGISRNDILKQSDAIAYVDSVDAGSSQVVIDSAQTWTTGVADVEHLKGIDCQLEWNPDFAGNPAGLKQYYEMNVLFKTIFQRECVFAFYSDVNQSEKPITITSNAGNGAFGDFTFGEEVWGGEVGKTPVRTGIPRNHSRCNQLSVRFENRVAYSDFQLNGLSLTYNPISTRTEGISNG